MSKDEHIILAAIKKFKDKNITLNDLKKFQQCITVIYPWCREYNKLRRDANKLFNIYPLMIVLAKTVSDVVSALRFAKIHNICICARSGGHSAEAYSICEGMVIDQRKRNNISVSKYINQGYSLVKIESGALLDHIVKQLSKFDLAIPAGTCGAVGITGLTLGGGQGFLMRRFGVTSDLLHGVQIVLANEKVINASDHDYNDIFWACRGGGGGNFGIVTQLVFRVPILKYVTIFEIQYPFKFVKYVIDAWQRWAPFAVDELTAELNIISDQHGNLHVNITGQFIEDADRLRKLLKPVLLSCFRPDITLLKTVLYKDAFQHFNGNGVPLPYFKVKNAYVSKLWPDEALDIIEKFMRHAPPNSKLELDPMRGAISRIPETATAFVHRTNLFWVLYSTDWSNKADTPKRMAWISEFYEAMRDYVSCHAYVNQIDHDQENFLCAYYGKNLDKLMYIKQQYDPDNIFNFPQSIPRLDLN